MSITFVSSLYNLSNNVDFYVNWFEKLAQLPVSIILFCDEIYDVKIPERENVKKIRRDLIEFPIYQRMMTNGSIMPSKRSQEKDTREYLSLMNTKMDFMKEAVLLCETEYLSWIDAGIFKIIKDIDKISSFLSVLRIEYKKGMIIPGCWNKEEGVSLESICWRFCGGFFIVHRNILPLIYDTIYEKILKITEDRILWEVNIWALVEKDYPELFEWYSADHNDKIFNIPMKYMRVKIKIPVGELSFLEVVKSYLSIVDLYPETYVEMILDKPDKRYNQVLKGDGLFQNSASGFFSLFTTNRILYLKTDKRENTLEKIVPQISTNENIVDNFILDDSFDYTKPIDHKVCERLNRAVDLFPFNDFIRETVARLMTKVIKPVLAIDFMIPEEDPKNPYSKFIKDICFSKLQLFIQANPQIGSIVLNCDSKFIPEVMKEVSGIPVLMIDNKKWIPLQTMAIRLLMMSQCDMIVASCKNDFHELVYLFNKCRAQLHFLL